MSIHIPAIPSDTTMNAVVQLHVFDHLFSHLFASYVIISIRVASAIASIRRIIVCCKHIANAAAIAMLRFRITRGRCELSFWIYVCDREKGTCDIMIYAYCISSSECDLAYNLNGSSYENENSIVAAGTNVYTH